MKKLSELNTTLLRSQYEARLYQARDKPVAEVPGIAKQMIKDAEMVFTDEAEREEETKSDSMPRDSIVKAEDAVSKLLYSFVGITDEENEKLAARIVQAVIAML